MESFGGPTSGADRVTGDGVFFYRRATPGTINTDWFQFRDTSGNYMLKVNGDGSLWFKSGVYAIWAHPTSPTTSAGHIRTGNTPTWATSAFIMECATVQGFSFQHNNAASNLQIEAITIKNTVDTSEVTINGKATLSGWCNVGTTTDSSAAGDFAAGSSIGARFFFDQSVPSINFKNAAQLDFFTVSGTQIQYDLIAGGTGRLIIGANNNVASITIQNGATQKFSIFDNGTTFLDVVANQALTFGTNNTARWNMSAANGSLLASTDGTPSIGASDANRPLALWLSGPSLTKGSGTGYTLNDSGSVRGQTFKCTVTFAGLAAAALTADVTLCTLPAKARIKAIYADTTIKYIGGAVSAATLKIGSTVGGAEVIASHDVFTAAVTKGLADADMGTALTRAAAIQGGYMPSFTATTAITARLTTVTANTNALTQGSTTYYIEYEILP